MHGNNAVPTVACEKLCGFVMAEPCWQQQVESCNAWGTFLCTPAPTVPPYGRGGGSNMTRAAVSPQQEGGCVPDHLLSHQGHGPAVLCHGAGLKEVQHGVHNAGHSRRHGPRQVGLHASGGLAQVLILSGGHMWPDHMVNDAGCRHAAVLRSGERNGLSESKTALRGLPLWASVAESATKVSTCRIQAPVQLYGSVVSFVADTS